MTRQLRVFIFLFICTFLVRFLFPLQVYADFGTSADIIGIFAAEQGNPYTPDTDNPFYANGSSCASISYLSALTCDNAIQSAGTGNPPYSYTNPAFPYVSSPGSLTVPSTPGAYEFRALEANNANNFNWYDSSYIQQYAFSQTFWVPITLTGSSVCVTPVSSTSTLNWGSVPGVVNMDLYRDSVYLKTVPAPPGNTTDGPLTPGSTHTYQIRAYS